VYVVPTSRGKGIATDLLEEVLRQAQEADATVVLAVRPSDFTSMDEVALREWYLRHGFKDHATWGEMGVMVTQ
jgi:ribosomal protein S18 acetylase RimI-like enzyme